MNSKEIKKRVVLKCWFFKFSTACIDEIVVFFRFLPCVVDNGERFRRIVLPVFSG
jgi:hypothetical protein